MPPIAKSPLFTFLVGTELRTTVSLFSLVLCLGLLLGFATPVSSDLLGSSWPRASNVIGWLYFSAWSVSFWPQVLLNIQRGSVEGLSFDFLLLNLLGFTCYTVYNGSLYWNPTVRSQYQLEYSGKLPGVHANDVFFGLHAVAVTALTIAQCLVLRREPGQAVSWPTRLAAAAAVVGIAIYASVCAGSAQTCGDKGWFTFVLAISYVKLAISCSKYIPQVFININRKSTEGWSIHNVMLDFTGGLLSVVQQIGDAQNTGDWASIVGGNPVKFGLGFASMVFDIIFAVQHYILYPKAEAGAEEGEEGDGDMESLLRASGAVNSGSKESNNPVNVSSP